ncbi:MAG: VacJ family lipoprotein, partial [Rickettsiales bacterium]|nr:VacJ family lipoprotein [Rickettsiales bacterium]
SLPLSAFNSLMQGKIDNSLATTSTFLINSTIGIFGMIDVASNRGILYNKEDFGQTLANYGMKSGPYIVLPILGPSSTLNLTGEIIDRAISPFGFNSLNLFSKQPLLKNENRIILTITSGIDKRDQLDPLITSVNKESLDPYATIRSAYLQNRQFEISK